LVRPTERAQRDRLAAEEATLSLIDAIMERTAHEPRSADSVAATGFKTKRHLILDPMHLVIEI
jgi:hypothetical protein